MPRQTISATLLRTYMLRRVTEQTLVSSRPACTCRLLHTYGDPSPKRTNGPFRVVRHKHPAFAQLTDELSALPRFRTRGSTVKILQEPTQFYDTLLSRIRQAKRRIFLASLYIGKEEHELIRTLHGALEANSELRVTILLDYLRSTRENPRPSSASLVASLTAKYPDRVDLRLFHTPELHGWRKKIVPRRFDEGWGLQHMKCYGFDDSVIISGANLSSDYFTNRQDRYIEIPSHPALADYFQELIDTTGQYSFTASATDTSSQYPALDIRWPNSNKTDNPLESDSAYREMELDAHDAFLALTKKWSSRKPSALFAPLAAGAPAVFDTSIRPVLQMGPFDIKQETQTVVPTIFRAGNGLATAPGGHDTTIDWTSGYFSVRPEYLRYVLDSKAIVRIVTAHPEVILCSPFGAFFSVLTSFGQANGFFESAGVSKYIPPAYTYLMRQFYDRVEEQRKRRRKTSSHVDLKEWKRTGWTYHAKGIWLRPMVSPTTRQPLDASPMHDANDNDDDLRDRYPATPYLTLVGSSNYGQRSAERDLEANVLITTFSPSLRRQLQDEIHHIREHARGNVDDKLFARKDRQVGWGVRLAARTIETML